MEAITSFVNLAATKGNVLGVFDFGLNARFQALADILGFPMDQVRYIILLLLMYPLAGIHRLIPGSGLKHIVSIVGGLWLCQLCFAEDWIHSFISSFVAFVLMRTVRGKYMHVLVWVWMMTYMSGSHLYRMWTNYLGWDLDYTGPQMILTQKLTSLAFALYDGNYNKHATEEQKQRSLKKAPSFLEFFGYVYFHPGFLAGPAFDYTEYLDILTPEKSGPNRIISSFKTLLYSLACFVVYVGLGVSFPQFKPATYFTATWMDLPFLTRVGYMWVIAFITRMRYYFAWLLAEGACVMAGLGYNSKEKKWNLLRNADPIAFETALNMRACTIKWNILTSRWLKQTVYERTPPAFRNYAVYIVSAFWHGFYPGYYMFFLTVGVFTDIPAQARKKIRPMFLQKNSETGTALKPVYDACTWLATTLIINYWVMSFLLLDFHKALQFWTSMYFYGHILPIPMFILLKFIKAPPAPPRNQAPAKKEE